jgi:predicted Zn-dependent protease
MAAKGGSKVGPLPVLAGLLVVAGGFGLVRGRSSDAADTRCEADPAACATAESANSGHGAPPPAPVLEQRSACRNVGYLCAELASSDRVQLRRWKDFSGTIVVYVPRPDFESSGDAVQLQEAAARGLRAWNGQPFQILTDLRGDRSPMFAVRWTRTLSGNQIGVARTQWSPQTGLQVVAIELSTRNPYDPSRLNDARQVQLTAAHEMGHALGLPHSGSERDVMYPSNTATSMSAQDYRSMEALYDFEDGTEIVRGGS